MSYIAKTIKDVIKNNLNTTTFLPAIQRQYVWGTDDIEKLFDSIMGDFPINTFLFWKIAQKDKGRWDTYEFIREFDSKNPHNKSANLNGLNDIYLVLDGQQRLTSLFIGLRGSYQYLRYGRLYKTKLYLNILKEESVADDSPEELTYQFKFRVDDSKDEKDSNPQFWYEVGKILDHNDSEDAKKSVRDKLSHYSDAEKDIANRHIGRLHKRINDTQSLNYYEETSDDYDKVVKTFIRANTGGVKLEYSDILLSTATAQFKTLNAKKEIHDFTASINAIGSNYSFEKDFVLKGSLYLTDGLPIKYKLNNFTKENLGKIEDNWANIKGNIAIAVELVSKFGFIDKNLVSKMALLPIAYYLSKKKTKNFVNSTDSNDVKNQIIIQKWLIIAFFKNAFGSSSDTTLKNLQDVINAQTDFSYFPYEALNKKLNIESSFNEVEIENLLSTNYKTKYSFLILSLLYPDRDWKDGKYQEDHIFPKSEFTPAKLKKRGYDQGKIEEYQKFFNCILNLELLTPSENNEKSAKAPLDWLPSRDDNFKKRHTIPITASYEFDNFIEFVDERRKLLQEKLKIITLID
jgi:uncharacterized protein with ParB-like and HNH nuclease domain